MLGLDSRIDKDSLYDEFVDSKAFLESIVSQNSGGVSGSSASQKWQQQFRVCSEAEPFVSERERRYMLSPVRLSVTFVRPTHAVQIFGNISTALGTLAIH